MLPYPERMTAVIPEGRIRGVVTVIPCADLDATMDFFREALGFRIDVISPADSPSTVVMSGHGTTIRLQRVAGHFDPGVVQVLCDDPGDFGLATTELTAPNGTRIQLLSADPGIEVPRLQQSLVVSTIRGNAQFGVGRAGMNYRDLIPDRQGGRFIASHIRIPDGGPVPDYVHFHKVRFQLIFVASGWVKVVYEDQGEPFVMEAGDCVLQPPTIRHRVLESSDGLEVIEIGCPAEHDTIAEHVITLPTGRTLPDREYGGQLFVRHRAASSAWDPFRVDGFVTQDLGIGHATHGLAGARVIEPRGGNRMPRSVIDNEFLFTYVLSGRADLETGAQPPQPLEAGDSFVIPADLPFALSGISADARFLEVSLPADLQPREVQ